MTEFRSAHAPAFRYGEEVNEDMDRLRQIAENNKPSAKKKASEWQAPQVDNLRHKRILAFDQSLNNTGWVFLENDWNGLRISQRGTIRGQSDEKGFLGNYQKSLGLMQMVTRIMVMHPLPPDMVIFEQPAVVGHRTDSALLAGQVIYLAAVGTLRTTPVRMVSNQAMKSALLAPGERLRGAEGKRAVGKVVEALIPVDARAEGPWNEHVRDAAALAIYALTPEGEALWTS